MTRHTLGSFINDGESVLDVGCGPGWNFDHFMLYGPAISQYKGMDYSERFVRVANQRAMQVAGTSSGPFVKGDVRHVAEEDGSWDVVVMQDVLEHTNGYEEPVREALRVARKRAIFSFWRMQDTPGHINDDGDDGYGAHYDRHEWEAFLDTLDLHWSTLEIHPETKGHSWNFYVVDKEEKHGE
jgi:ubiquinone/menaquinone biosynthesis C-methylase UbiE